VVRNVLGIPIKTARATPVAEFSRARTRHGAKEGRGGRSECVRVID